MLSLSKHGLSSNPDRCRIPMTLSEILKQRQIQIGFLVLSALLIFLARQGDNGISNFDGSYYAQKAKELLTGDSLWVNTFHGVPDFDKPPMHLWLVALAYKLFGVSGYSALLVPALMGTFTIFLTYRFAERMFQDRWVAFLAAYTLLFPGYYLSYARRAMVDVTLVFFVTLAMYGLYLGTRNSRWYLVFGFGTAAAILTKSVLGVFPLMIGFFYLIWTRQYKEMVNPYMVAAVVIALGLGSTWHIVNWTQFGSAFVDVHFGWMMFERTIHGDPSTVRKYPFVLGYLIDLAKNYWPWFPVLLVGAWVFAKKAVKTRDPQSTLLILWIGVVLVVMSASKAQYLRYVLSIFPALGLLVGKTLGDWTREKWQDRVLPAMAGAILVVVFLLNSTPIQIKQCASCKRLSADMRALAPAVHLNTPADGEILNFRLHREHPRWAFLFYANRWVAEPTADPEQIPASFERDPTATWLTRVQEYATLKAQYPEQLYLIQSTGRYAYFTSAQNRDRIGYHFSDPSMNVVR